MVLLPLLGCLWIPEDDPGAGEVSGEVCVVGCGAGVADTSEGGNDTAIAVDTDSADTDTAIDTGATGTDTGTDTGSADTDTGVPPCPEEGVFSDWTDVVSVAVGDTVLVSQFGCGVVQGAACDVSGVVEFHNWGEEGTDTFAGTLTLTFMGIAPGVTTCFERVSPYAGTWNETWETWYIAVTVTDDS